MRKRFSLAVLIFLAIFIVGAIYFLRAEYKNISQNIKDTLLKHHVMSVEELTGKFLKQLSIEDLENRLRNDNGLRKKLNEFITLLSGSKYRHIFVVTKRKDFFTILLDGSDETFAEPFEPLDKKSWDLVYKTGKPLLIKENVKGVWYTYLKPILYKNKTVAMMSIDFSVKESLLINDILGKFYQAFVNFQTLGLFLLATVLVLVYLDRKRLIQLEKASEKIRKINENLEKRIREEIKKSREKDKQLLAQSRLAQMGEMINMIAHQWRQPLNAISSVTLELNLKAEMDIFTKEDVVFATKQTLELTNHLSKTIEDFRNFFKKNREKEEVFLDKIVDDVIRIVRHPLEIKGVKLEIIRKNPLKVKTFSSELKQVLLNLIKNSQDAFEERGVDKPLIQIEIVENKIVVKDNAGGIPSEIIDKIFDPYFSTKNKNGTGIGLYMSKIIVEKHCGGELTAGNWEKGAVFCIKLPKN